MTYDSAKSLLVALGSNLPFGDSPPEATVLSALAVLDELSDGGVRHSGLWRTPCFPVGNGPDFVNAAVIMTLRHVTGAEQVLALLHDVEKRFGRERSARWGGRTLDLDLIAMGDSVLPDPAEQRRWMDLSADRQAVDVPQVPIVPHPRMQDRAFVLVPLAQVAPDWRHPVLGRSVAQMLADLPQADRDAVTPL